jgi:hypothetical protein
MPLRTGVFRISLCKMCNRIHLRMELNCGKTLNKWVDVLSMMHMELINII